MAEDPRTYRTDPDGAFADRLEQALVRRMGFDGDADDPRPDDEEMPIMDLQAVRTRTPRRWLFAVAAGVVVVAAIGAAALANADDDPEHSTVADAGDGVAVAFEVAWPDLDGLERNECVPTDVTFDWANQGRCIRRFVGEATFSGDLAGTGLWMMLGNLGEAADAQDSAVTVPATFTATYLVQAEVPGCGTGEFMIVEELRFDGWESGAFSGTWRVVTASGRDALAGISGGGEVPGDHPDEGTTQATRTGTVSCGD